MKNELFNNFDKEQRKIEIDKDIKRQDKKISRLIQYIQDKDLDIEYGESINAKPCFIANWNDFESIEKWLTNTQIFDYDYIEIIWSDTYSFCPDCCRYYDTSNACYGDESHGIWVSDCEIVCKDCAIDNIDDIEEYYKNQYNRAIPSYLIDEIKKLGYICLDDENNESCKIFESGFHPGQNDNPSKIIGQLETEGYLDKYDYLFCINSIGQFDVHFSLFIKEIETLKPVWKG